MKGTNYVLLHLEYRGLFQSRASLKFVGSFAGERCNQCMKIQIIIFLISKCLNPFLFVKVRKVGTQAEKLQLLFQFAINSATVASLIQQAFFVLLENWAQSSVMQNGFC